ncbi:MAG TPA: ABC transporter permease [Flavisolibacter sp.]
MNLFISLRSETLKIKRTAAFYFTLAGAAVVPVIFLLNVLSDGIEDTRKDPLNSIFKLGSEMNGLVIFPMFVILICTLLPQIEYRNNTWKQVLTSPQTKANVFMAKFLNIHLLIVVFLVANLLFMSITVVAAHFIDPTLDLLNQPFNGTRLLVNTLNSYLTILAVCAIQFWIGLRSKNFIVPIAFGLALWLAGTIMVFEYHSSFANYFPYSFHTFSMYAKIKSQINQVVWTSAGYAFLFLFIGFLDFRRRRVNQ